MLEVYKHSHAYFEEFFRSRGFKKVGNWEYEIQLEDGFRKGVSVKPSRHHFDYKFEPGLYIFHKDIGKFKWSGVRESRKKRNAAAFLLKEKFCRYDEVIISTSLDKMMFKEGGIDRFYGYYEFNDLDKVPSACTLVCEDFDYISDVFYSAYDTKEKNIEFLSDSQQYCYPVHQQLLLAILFVLDMEGSLKRVISDLKANPPELPSAIVIGSPQQEFPEKIEKPSLDERTIDFIEYVEKAIVNVNNSKPPQGN
tara:strand:- start:119018 stop:119773 length:756 start_codon:yes stop_codon:yes gene_type:complete